MFQKRWVTAKLNQKPIESLKIEQFEGSDSYK